MCIKTNQILLRLYVTIFLLCNKNSWWMLIVEMLQAFKHGRNIILSVNFNESNEHAIFSFFMEEKIWSYTLLSFHISGFIGYHNPL